ncbi:hypothetical protein [Acinetobacter bouvetii]|uniref:Uncharacterized protein n=1 Tax=Acinetobacter bouvetii TaxID=202951 RepID=A0A811GH06_9GAMM|nr:hypothetical protein [Acinetobacter bouvetii]CAB1221605.1 hypothetical protein SFB21_2890 [Acinetobacter bouvetii]
MSNKLIKTYKKGQGSTETRVESTPKNTVQKSSITRKNTGESTQNPQFYSPESCLLTDFSTPIYNMRVTID